ncbi:MAG: CBS domain-containing protein [Proteobacteria bacterium]|nr:CBS domain-containing protein [Pseudomonadota bacterium]MBS0495611.1 CBS domain-containing protein [Pseudomonadota bacterium]
MTIPQPYRSIEQVLAAKRPGRLAIDPDEPVVAALQMMADNNVGCLLVMQAERLVGVISERDYARKVALVGKTSKDTLVREIMTPNPYCVSAANSVPECMALMTEKRVRHLPVVDGDRVIGVLSIGDIVKEVISHHEHVIRGLEIERLRILGDSSSY